MTKRPRRIDMLVSEATGNRSPVSVFGDRVIVGHGNHDARDARYKVYAGPSPAEAIRPRLSPSPTAEPAS